MAKVTIFGLAGTGTSTVGRLLAQTLNLPFISGGEIFRQEAQALGKTLYEFEALCAAHPAYDRKLDQALETYGRQTPAFVCESRLGWHFIPDSFKVKIDCEDDVRLSRVAGRDGLSLKDATEKTFFREQSHRIRYKEFYGIEDMTANGHFNLRLDSTAVSPAVLVDAIITALDQRPT